MPFNKDRFCGLPIVGIMRNLPAAAVLPAAEAVVRGGIRTLEITVGSPGAYTHMERLARHFGGRVNVGAGTVTTRDQYAQALAAGASFIVTPTVAEEVIVAGKADGIPVFAGAYTPTEIHRAWTLGAYTVKVFPADQLGPGYIRAVLGPLSNVKLMPTGGVTVESLPAFRAAGACGYGVGSPLFSLGRIAAGDYDWLETRARAFRDAYVYS